MGENYILELLWWPEYWHGHPHLTYCAGATFRGFVLGAFIPLSAGGQIHRCDSQTGTFTQNDKFLAFMPDDTLLQTQWNLYGACSGQSQTDYFHHLAGIFESVGIPSTFLSPKNHFEIDSDQIKREFRRLSAKLRLDALDVFCNSDFLSKIQIKRGSMILESGATCERSRVHVIARMPLAE